MRSDPEAFGPSMDSVEALQGAISAIGGARWAVGTTYQIDARVVDSWVEETALPRDTLLLVHPQHWNGQRLPKRVLVAPAGTGMHAKTLLVRGVNGLAVQIGSGNLTIAGVGGRHRDVVWTHSTRTGVGISGVLAHLVKWLIRQFEAMPFRANGNWTNRLKDLQTVLPRPHLGEPELLDNSERSLLDQLRDRVGRKDLSSLTVVTPYLTPEPLAKLPATRKLVIIVPGSSGERRLVRVKGLMQWRDRLRYLVHEGSRFTHAKIYIFGFRTSGLLAFGSANCTNDGLMSRAVPGSGKRAEVLMMIPLDLRQLEAVEKGLASLPLEGTFEESPDEPEGEVEIPTLVAWYYSVSHVLEVWISSGAPTGTATLLGASGKRICSLSLVEADGCYRTHVPPVWTLVLPGDGGQLQWGSLSGPVCFIQGTEPDAEDLSLLWGGDLGAGEVGALASANSLSPTESSDPTESLGAVLDEYEVRAERVCGHLRRQLRSALPEGIERIMRVWSERPDLGLGPFPEDIAAGTSLFLGHRLLAAIRHNPHDLSVIRDRIRVLRLEITKLRKTHVPQDIRRHLARWANEPRWPEDRKSARGRP